MISGPLMLNLLVQLVVAGLIFWLLYWFLGQVALPQPFQKVAIVILALAMVVFLINILLSLSGTPLFHWR